MQGNVCDSVYGKPHLECHRYLKSESDSESIHVVAGNKTLAGDFLPVASQVEFKFYPKALEDVGVVTLSETLVFIRIGGEERSFELLDELFADVAYLKAFGELTRR